jgi:hypothetical protein
MLTLYLEQFWRFWPVPNVPDFDKVDMQMADQSLLPTAFLSSRHDIKISYLKNSKDFKLLNIVH